MLGAETSPLSVLLRSWSVPMLSTEKDRLSEFIRLLLEWNVRVNVTGARDAEEVIGDHFPDSLALIRLVPLRSRLIDVGSGGGLPAIPLAILRPDCLLTLVEPRAKRVAFLNTAVRVLNCPNVRILRQRLEDCEGHSFDVACSRATFSPAEWLAVAPRLILPGGRAIVLSTCEVSPRPVGSVLVDSLEYKTGRGAARWAGSYCST